MPFWSKSEKREKPASLETKSGINSFDQRFGDRSNEIKRLVKELDDAGSFSQMGTEELALFEAKANRILALADEHTIDLENELRREPLMLEVFPFLPTAFNRRTEDATYYLGLIRTRQNALSPPAPATSATFTQPVSSAPTTEIPPIHQQYSSKTWTVSTVAGEGDFTTIGAAIEAAADWDTIAVSAGGCFESLTISKPIHIVGSRDPRSVPGDEPGDDPVITLIGGEEQNVIAWRAPGGSMTNLVVRHELERGHGDLDRACIKVDGGHLLIERCAFFGGANTDIVVSDGRLELLNSAVVEAPTGLGTRGASQVSIRGVVFSESFFCSIVLGSDSIAEISRCECDASCMLSGKVHLFEDNRVNGLQIYGDPHIRNNTITGLTQVSAAEGVANPLFEGNTFDEAPIWVKDGATPTFRGNRIKGRPVLQDLCGMLVSGESTSATIVDNEFYENEGPALIVTDGAYVDARSNTFRDNSAGCAVIKQGNGHLLGNRFFHNTGNVCILVENSNGPDVDGNILEDNTSVGIGVQENARINIGNNIVRRNEIGIIVQGGSHANLRANKVNSNQEVGVLFQSGSWGSIVNNDLRWNDDQNLGIADDSQALFDLDDVIASNLLED
jgi:parallel beta-helix repeat protein